MHAVRRIGLASAALAAIVGCADSTGPAGFQSVSLNFRVDAAAPSAVGPSRVSGPSLVAGPPLVLEGTNGTLTINEIRVIVDEAELHPADGSCDVVEPSGDDLDDDCPDFEAPPRFLDLPLDGQPVAAVTVLVPAGSYKRLDFEIENLEDDEEDPVRAAEIAAVRAQVLAEFPDWPRKASALVTGSFTPSGGSAVDFRVFLEAEVEVEIDLVPHIVVDDDGGTSRDLTVDISPQIWFLAPDGTVLDLSQYDYDATGQLLEFEVEMEDGFTEIEFD